VNALTLRGGRAYDGADPIDVVLNDGTIAAIRPTGGPVSGEVVDLDGRFVGPGLWDAHVHFMQWMISSRRIDLADTRSPEDAIAAVRRAVATDAPRTDGVLVGYGYRDGL